MLPLRYGIIGSGMMGQEHIRNIALLEGARVTAVADPDETMRARAARLAGAETQSFGSHEDLLSAGLADVLVIASPDQTHGTILVDALASGLPILVEKPLCTTVEDCRKVVALAQGRRAPVWVAMEYRYMPAIARLRVELGKGTAGRLRMLSIREHRFPFLDKVGDWNRFARNTGGTLVEKCCHFFDLMRLLIGAEPWRVYASGGQDVNHLEERYHGEIPDIIDNAMVIVDFDNGVRAALDLCMFAEGDYYQEHIAAVGDLAKIEALVPAPPRFWPEGATREAELIVSPRRSKRPQRETVAVAEHLRAAGDHHGSTYYQHLGFARIIRDGGSPEVTLEDGVIAVEMGAAAEQSIRTGQPVFLGPAKSVAGREEQR